MINFTQVEQAVRELKAQFNQGQLDATTFQTSLVNLMDVGADGHYWMFGHDSERWFRYEGQQWAPATPPVNGQAAPAAAPSEETWQTLNLGWFTASLVTLGAISALVYYSAIF